MSLCQFFKVIRERAYKGKGCPPIAIQNHLSRPTNSSSVVLPNWSFEEMEKYNKNKKEYEKQDLNIYLKKNLL